MTGYFRRRRTQRRVRLSYAIIGRLHDTESDIVSLWRAIGGSLDSVITAVVVLEQAGVLVSRSVRADGTGREDTLYRTAQTWPEEVSLWLEGAGPMPRTDRV